MMMMTEKKVTTMTGTMEAAQAQALARRPAQAQTLVAVARKNKKNKKSKSKARFAVDPDAMHAGKVLNFKKKAHKTLYNTVTEGLYADVKAHYDLDAAKAQNFLQRINDRAKESTMDILKIPIEDHLNISREALVSNS